MGFKKLRKAAISAPLTTTVAADSSVSVNATDLHSPLIIETFSDQVRNQGFADIHGHRTFFDNLKNIQSNIKSKVSRDATRLFNDMYGDMPNTVKPLAASIPNATMISEDFDIWITLALHIAYQDLFNKTDELHPAIRSAINIPIEKDGTTVNWLDHEYETKEPSTVNNSILQSYLQNVVIYQAFESKTKPTQGDNVAKKLNDQQMTVILSRLQKMQINSTLHQCKNAASKLIIAYYNDKICDPELKRQVEKVVIKGQERQYQLGKMLTHCIIHSKILSGNIETSFNLSRADYTNDQLNYLSAFISHVGNIIKRVEEARIHFALRLQYIELFNELLLEKVDFTNQEYRLDVLEDINSLLLTAELQENQELNEVANYLTHTFGLSRERLIEIQNLLIMLIQYEPSGSQQKELAFIHFQNLYRKVQTEYYANPSQHFHYEEVLEYIASWLEDPSVIDKRYDVLSVILLAAQSNQHKDNPHYYQLRLFIYTQTLENLTTSAEHYISFSAKTDLMGSVALEIIMYMDHQRQSDPNKFDLSELIELFRTIQSYLENPAYLDNPAYLENPASTNPFSSLALYGKYQKVRDLLTQLTRTEGFRDICNFSKVYRSTQFIESTLTGQPEFTYEPAPRGQNGLILTRANFALKDDLAYEGNVLFNGHIFNHSFEFKQWENDKDNLNATTYTKALIKFFDRIYFNSQNRKLAKIAVNKFLRCYNQMSIISKVMKGLGNSDLKQEGEECNATRDIFVDSKANVSMQLTETNFVTLTHGEAYRIPGFIVTVFDFNGPNAIIEKILPSNSCIKRLYTKTNCLAKQTTGLFFRSFDSQPFIDARAVEFEKTLEVLEFIPDTSPFKISARAIHAELSQIKTSHTLPSYLVTLLRLAFKTSSIAHLARLNFACETLTEKRLQEKIKAFIQQNNYAYQLQENDRLQLFKQKLLTWVEQREALAQLVRQLFWYTVDERIRANYKTTRDQLNYLASQNLDLEKIEANDIPKYSMVLKTINLLNIINNKLVLLDCFLKEYEADAFMDQNGNASRLDAILFELSQLPDIPSAWQSELAPVNVTFIQKEVNLNQQKVSSLTAQGYIHALRENNLSKFFGIINYILIKYERLTDRSFEKDLLVALLRHELAKTDINENDLALINNLFNLRLHTIDFSTLMLILEAAPDIIAMKENNLKNIYMRDYEIDSPQKFANYKLATQRTAPASSSTSTEPLDEFCPFSVFEIIASQHRQTNVSLRSGALRFQLLRPNNNNSLQFVYFERLLTQDFTTQLDGNEFLLEYCETIRASYTKSDIINRLKEMIQNESYLTNYSVQTRLGIILTYMYQIINEDYIENNDELPYEVLHSRQNIMIPHVLKSIASCSDFLLAFIETKTKEPPILTLESPMGPRHIEQPEDATENQTHALEASEEDNQEPRNGLSGSGFGFGP